MKTMPTRSEVYARVLAGEKTGKWLISAIDAAGFELMSGDRLIRIEFDKVLEDSSRLAPNPRSHGQGGTKTAGIV